eukprot:3332553-Pleurochrysis_carterae.AAC.1
MRINVLRAMALGAMELVDSCSCGKVAVLVVGLLLLIPHTQQLAKESAESKQRARLVARRPRVALALLLGESPFLAEAQQDLVHQLFDGRRRLVCKCDDNCGGACVYAMVKKTWNSLGMVKHHRQLCMLFFTIVCFAVFALMNG